MTIAGMPYSSPPVFTKLANITKPSKKPPSKASAPLSLPTIPNPKISPFDNIPLLESLGKIGIEKAIDTLPNGIKNNREAIAETIENNVRSKIVKTSLSDPAYYEKMSGLLDEIIADRKTKAIEYEEYLIKVAELSKQVMAGKSVDTPAQLNTSGRFALYNNLLPKSAIVPGIVAASENPYIPDVAILKLTIEIDTKIKDVRSDNWRGNKSKEQQIKAALYEILKEVDEVERIFLIIQKQHEY
jgi:type I restriction enzyme R subunit